MSLIYVYFGLFKIWNTKSWECIHTHRSVSRASEVPVNDVIPLPQHPEHFVVCNHSNTVVVLNMRGQVRLTQTFISSFSIVYMEMKSRKI